MENLLQDPAFRTLGQPDSPWQLKTHEGVQAGAATLGGVLTLTTKWTRSVNWHIELIQGPFAVQAGQRLGIVFEACASPSLRFSVWLGQFREPFASLVSQNNHFGEETMPRTWQPFQHRWLVERDEPEARLVFTLGRVDTTLRLRNPRLLSLDAR